MDSNYFTDKNVGCLYAPCVEFLGKRRLSRTQRVVRGVYPEAVKGSNFVQRKRTLQNHDVSANLLWRYLITSKVLLTF
jgi:hypothetical protein